MEIMKYMRYLLLVAALLISGMYGWYLLSYAVNKQADIAAFAIIEDTLSSSTAYDIEQLRKLELRIQDNDFEESSKMIRKLIDDKVWLLNQCISEHCIALQERRNAP